MPLVGRQKSVSYATDCSPKAKLTQQMTPITGHISLVSKKR
jgi:hypothetical protein